MPGNRQVLRELQHYECRNTLAIAPDYSWPIVWQRARGARVWDCDGRAYWDLTAAFGVAAAGHANPHVTAAAHRQATQLLHGMGDVHPHALKAQLARTLSRLTFERWARWRPSRDPARQAHGKTLFGNSGFEAVEAALKTALLATHRRGIIAFHGAYHGTGYGTLAVTQRDIFHRPFHPQLRRFGQFLPFPQTEADLGDLARAIPRIIRQNNIGAILTEPIQGRGGIRIPPPGFLPLLRQLCDTHQILLILDEIFTGFGRTGAWFACERARVIPDLICLGKALTGGFPLSALVGKAELMDRAWPPSAGEAIHTTTFLGHPVGCAMALAQIRELQRLRLPQRSATLGHQLLAQLQRIQPPPTLRCTARGHGLMAGLELRHPSGQPAGDTAFEVTRRMLHHGYIILPEGEHGHVLSFTPPLTIPAQVLAKSVIALQTVLDELDRPVQHPAPARGSRTRRRRTTPRVQTPAVPRATKPDPTGKTGGPRR